MSLLFLVGCAPERFYQFNHLPTEAKAVIYESNWEFWEMLFVIPALLNLDNVQITKVNGQARKKHTKKIEVPPGITNLSVFYKEFRQYESIEEVCLTFNAEAGHKYKVKGKTLPHKFESYTALWTPWIEDLSTSKKVQFEFNMEDCLILQNSVGLNQGTISYTKLPDGKLLHTFVNKDDKETIEILEADHAKILIWKAKSEKDFNIYTSNRWDDEEGEHYSFWYDDGDGFVFLIPRKNVNQLKLYRYRKERYRIEEIHSVFQLIPVNKCEPRIFMATGKVPF
ncbi:MAG: hypothetical protein LHV69_04345 [Elusimicrobia bacterium]|nr:hypothetical protein [Candidatus Obscuribacterium magneticum]